ncbi:hypothetical protein [Streptomyces sp. NPDC047043]|uniref:hypothetical protein n=1 Tax=Streptomyces sp. NPDC047043 TaxID=3154497 RepID=UPI0033E62DF4
MTALTCCDRSATAGARCANGCGPGRAKDGPYSRVAMNSPVPVELIKDPEFNAHLDDLDHGKAALAVTTSRILPHVFQGMQAGPDEMRRAAKSSAYEARIIEDLVQPLGDRQPLVVAALESVGWLSALRWELVDTCAYAGNGGFTLIGQRLQGSHPDWEPFKRSFPGTLDPDRIYVEGLSSSQPLPLWPVARVEVCEDCDAGEIFLFHKFDKASGDITLRCGRDHKVPRDET